ncbi:MAG: metallophosphoesterase family protein [Deltaproteobacteria bacterium]|nr:metallophosphoesterase family protein [Deltaproteobacteria bacterium]
MRWAILADVHANLEALTAVLDHLGEWEGARVICAGDIVGYGPDPEACAALLKSRRVACVVGNHDERVLGRIEPTHSAAVAAVGWAWTRRALSTESLSWLASLPLVLRPSAEIAVFHGAWENTQTYVASARAAKELLNHAVVRAPTARLIVCGHTHQPTMAANGLGFLPLTAGESGVDTRRLRGTWLLNPGSVGQPRDGTHLARYVRYDDDLGRVESFALPYEHERTREKRIRAGLPDPPHEEVPEKRPRRVAVARWLHWTL